MGRQLNLTFQKLTGLIDSFNDRLTTYRLMLYFLLTLVGWALIGSFFKHQIPYNWHQILVSAGFLLAVCWAANKLISRLLNIPANKESDLITALILTLILSPPSTAHQFALTAAAGVAAIASKYIITFHKSHLFNPAAIGAFVGGELFHSYASWWVGTKFMTPVVFIGGLLIMRKMKRFTLVAAFMAFYILYLIFGTNSGGNLHFLWLELVATPVLFFAYVMLIEPLTSPSQISKYIPYALLVSLFYSVTKLKISPEEALLIGNIFTFAVAHNRRYALSFAGKRQEAEGIYSYGFRMPKGFSFRPGQYMEWTIAKNKTDSRGNRRYFTISSSPTEPAVMITLKHPPNASAFKQKLDELKPNDTILAGSLAGSFTLPKDPSRKLALMAGGVGITPFRSMIKYLVDSEEKRDITLLYSASSPAEFSFQNLFKKAEDIGVKTVYITDKADARKIKSLLPDFRERTFYISGPYPYVHAVETSLLSLDIGPSDIITDYFPGYGD